MTDKPKLCPVTLRWVRNAVDVRADHSYRKIANAKTNYAAVRARWAAIALRELLADLDMALEQAEADEWEAKQ